MLLKSIKFEMKKAGARFLQLLLVSVLLLSTACAMDEKPDTGMFSSLHKLSKEYDIKPLEKIDPKLVAYFDIPQGYSKSFMPIKDMKFYGHASGIVYQGKNLPDHHISNAKKFAREGLSNYFDGLGQVYVFDFNAVTPEGKSMPIRVAFNTGDGDCNDGYWGEAWNKDTKKVVVDIMSTDDTFTTLTARTKEPDIFDKAEIPILSKLKLGFHPVYVLPGTSNEFDDKEGFYYTGPTMMECTNNRKLAMVVALALRIFSVRLHDAYPKKYVRELDLPVH